MASRTEGDRPRRRLKLFRRLARDPGAMAPAREQTNPGSVFEVSTKVAGYDAVTTVLAMADLAPLVAAAQQGSVAPVLARPAAVATGSVVARPRTRPRRKSRRPRIGLALLVIATAALVWGLAAYEIWYLFLR